MFPGNESSEFTVEMENATMLSNSSTTPFAYNPRCTWNLAIVEWIKLSILLTGVIGNGLTILVITINKSLYSVTFATICLIAVADFLYCFSVILWEVFLVGYLNIENDFRNFVQCISIIWYKILTIFFKYVFDISYLVSVWLVATLSIFRYIIIAHPLKSMFILKKCVVVLTFVIVWLIAIVSSIWKNTSALHDTLSTTVVFMEIYSVPLIIIIIFHTLKLVSMKRNQFGNIDKHVKKMEKIVLTIILTFMFFPLPWHIFRLLQVFSGYEVGYIPQTLSGLFFLLNNCINPIFYAFLSPNIRRKTVQLVIYPCRHICTCKKFPCTSLGKFHKTTVYFVSTDTKLSSVETDM